MNGPVKHGATSDESFIMVGKRILQFECLIIETRNMLVGR